MRWSRVVFPVPDSPSTATISPRSTARSSPHSTSTRPPGGPKLLCSPAQRRIGSPNGLLVAQRLRRVELRGPPGGVEGRQERDGDGQEGDGHDVERTEK